jgi:quercetin dioxygenase-like cupin family protein
MPEFTKKNFKDIDDSAAGRMPGMEARFARSHIDSEHLGVSYFRYEPNRSSTAGHRHREQEEAYVVVEGSGRARLDDEIVELSQWDVLRVAPPVVRGFRAGPDGLVIVAVGGDKPEGGDGELVEDWWPED